MREQHFAAERVVFFSDFDDLRGVGFFGGETVAELFPTLHIPGFFKFVRVVGDHIVDGEAQRFEVLNRERDVRAEFVQFGFDFARGALREPVGAFVFRREKFRVVRIAENLQFDDGTPARRGALRFARLARFDVVSAPKFELDPVVSLVVDQTAVRAFVRRHITAAVAADDFIAGGEGRRFRELRLLTRIRGVVRETDFKVLVPASVDVPGENANRRDRARLTEIINDARRSPVRRDAPVAAERSRGTVRQILRRVDLVGDDQLRARKFEQIQIRQFGDFKRHFVERRLVVRPALNDRLNVGGVRDVGRRH